MCCKECGTHNIEDSDFCPEDTETRIAKTPFYKKWWVWTIASIAVIVSIAAVFSYRRDKQFYKKILDLLTQQ